MFIVIENSVNLYAVKFDAFYLVKLIFGKYFRYFDTIYCNWTQFTFLCVRELTASLVFIQVFKMVFVLNSHKRHLSPLVTWRLAGHCPSGPSFLHWEQLLHCGILFWCKQYFNSAQWFKFYTGFIRPCLEYCSSPHTSLLDRVESKDIRLNGGPSLTSTLDPLSLRRKVASLSLFYRYFFGHCSDELAACIPPPMARPHSTRWATFGHNYCVELSNARIGSVMVSYPLLPFFGTLSLLLYFQLPSTFLPSKGRSITTLGTRWHDFFYCVF